MFFNSLLTNAGGSSFGLILMIVMIAVFYFLVMRPQKKREKKEAEMRAGVAVGDEVTTIGGIIGKVVSVKDETFVLETTKDKTKIRFLKGAIRSIDVCAADLAAQIMSAKEAEAAEAAAEANADTEEPAESKKDLAKKAKEEKARAKAEKKEQKAKEKAEKKAK
jgi:preprotein translocase subunit YajC